LEIQKVDDQLESARGHCRRGILPRCSAESCRLRVPRRKRQDAASTTEHPALRLIAARPDLFYRQGNVAAGYRHRNGKTFGPYHRLSYRLGGRQFSIYLGRSPKLVEQVRRALAAIQKPLAQRRFFNQLERQIRASLRVQKLRMGALLRPFGLRLKGYEVRGWRHSPLRRFLPRSRRWSPRVSIRWPGRWKKWKKGLGAIRVKLPSGHSGKRRRSSSTPAARLLRYLEARDGPQALSDTLSQSCLMPTPCLNDDDSFIARLMGFTPARQGLAK
jgi:hypothetical protein